MNTIDRVLRKLVVAASIAGLSLALISCSQSTDDEQASMEQPAPPPEGAPPPQGGMSRIDQVIAAISGLTEEQSAQVKSVLQGTEDAIRNLQATMPEWNEESMAAINKLWDQEAENLHAVLDEAQQAEYDAWAASWLAERAQDEH